MNILTGQIAVRICSCLYLPGGFDVIRPVLNTLAGSRVTLFVAITEEKCIVRKTKHDCSSATWETDYNRVTIKIT
jgi:hypothetical protein